MGGSAAASTTSNDHAGGPGRTPDLARLYRSLGLALCKPDPGQKKPTYLGWSTRSLEPGDFIDGDLIGILGGPLSNGNRPGHALAIIDLDAAEAVATADAFLPPTGLEEGRPPHQIRAHRSFLVPGVSIPSWAWSTAEQAAAAAKKAKGHPGPFKKAFNHAKTKQRVIDLIGTGEQAACPCPAGQ